MSKETELGNGDVNCRGKGEKMGRCEYLCHKVREDKNLRIRDLNV